MEHPKVLPTLITLEVKKKMGQQILDNKIIVTIG
jgi:hypothetical protein